MHAQAISRRGNGMNSRSGTERFESVDMLGGGGLGIFLRSRGAAKVVSAVGSINRGTSPHFGRKLQGLIERRERLLLIDLGGVERIDSSAIATLLDCLHHLWQHGGQMAVFGVRPEIRAWFEVFMLDGVLRVCANEDQAYESCLPGTDPVLRPAPRTN